MSKSLFQTVAFDTVTIVVDFRANVEAALKQVITTANSTNSLWQIGVCCWRDLIVSEPVFKVVP